MSVAALKLKQRSFAKSAHDVFSHEVSDWFSGVRSGHLGKWRYDYLAEGGPASGGHLWESLAAHGKDYYVSREGDRALDQSLDFVRAKLGSRPEWIIDLGPGALRPAKRNFLDAFGQNSIYVPVDMSGRFSSGARILEEEGLVKAVQPCQNDFTRDDAFTGLGGKKLFLFLGSTLGNLPGAYGTDPSAEAVKLLGNIRKGMTQGDKLLIIVDGNQNMDEVLRCYYDELSQTFLLSLMHKIARDLNPMGDFDPYAWKPQFIWNEKTSQCTHMKVATKSQNFSLNGRTYIVPEGTRYTASNSYKFTREAMRSIMKNAGFRAEINTDLDSPMTVILAEAV